MKIGTTENKHGVIVDFEPEVLFTSEHISLKALYGEKEGRFTWGNDHDFMFPSEEHCGGGGGYPSFTTESNTFDTFEEAEASVKKYLKSMLVKLLDDVKDGPHKAEVQRAIDSLNQLTLF